MSERPDWYPDRPLGRRRSGAAACPKPEREPGANIVISQCWRCVRDLCRVLRTWLDPSTRRPLILLTLVAFAIFLWPLAVDVARALFSAIPVSVRWFGGQAAIVAGFAAGLWRLYQVRPSDEWPAAGRHQANDAGGAVDAVGLEAGRRLARRSR